MPHTTLEIFIRRLPSGSLAADAALTPSSSTATVQLATGVPLELEAAALRGLESSADDYGRQLSAQLRLRLDASADDLHAL